LSPGWIVTETALVLNGATWFEAGSGGGGCSYVATKERLLPT
jgi:hypothetical protein